MQHNEQELRVTFNSKLNKVYTSSDEPKLLTVKERPDISNYLNNLSTTIQEQFQAKIKTKSIDEAITENKTSENQALCQHIVLSFIASHKKDILEKQEYRNVFDFLSSANLLKGRLIDIFVREDINLNEDEQKIMKNYLKSFIIGKNFFEKEIKLDISFHPCGIMTKEEFAVLKTELTEKQKMFHITKQKATEVKEETKKEKSKSWLSCFGCGSKKDVNKEDVRETVEKLYHNR
jgi:hypothetical protein